MARQLIKAARANGDISLPGVGNVSHNIYRWERGIVGPSERYALYCCHAFGIQLSDFPADHEEAPAQRLSTSASDAGTVPDLLAGGRALFRELGCEIVVIRVVKAGLGCFEIREWSHISWHAERDQITPGKYLDM
jgi:hypothetical protein